jgi:RNA polymerase subunit RPABC4/transcription elongation factor Spt4
MATDGTFTCPNCGAEISTKARACPECGSDEKTGWSDETIYDGTGIEDPEEFDYEVWKRRESGGGKRMGKREWLWWFVAVLVLAVFVWLLIR